jgi:aryl-alcohol dehydrogenase-like predicted oxidoreductase
MNLSKLTIGTAQFGLDYGIANRGGQVNFEEIQRILDFAFNLGIDTLDTAIAYGDSETRLGKAGVSNWNIVSKLPSVPKNCRNVTAWVIDSVEGSLDRLKVNSLFGLLLHRPDDLNSEFGEELYEGLETVKRFGMVSQLGVSVYAPGELRTLNNFKEFTVVQSSLNIIDRRILELDNFVNEGANRFTIQTRSAFLQGLLLMNPQQRPRKFSKWNNLWDVLDKFIEESGLTRLEVCIRYVMAVEAVNKVIVGIDSLIQLKEICVSASGELPEIPMELVTGDSVLINPALWSTIE